jgi:hypothetical protein
LQWSWELVHRIEVLRAALQARTVLRGLGKQGELYTRKAKGWIKRGTAQVPHPALNHNVLPGTEDLHGEALER